MMERTNLVQMRVGEVQVDTVQAVQLEDSVVVITYTKSSFISLNN